MTDGYDYSDLSLHGKFTEDGSQFRLYVLLNGVELPVQYLNVHDYREKFTEANEAGGDTGTKSKRAG